MSDEVKTVSWGMVRGLPHLILRAEAAAVLSAAIVAYALCGASWWWFAALFLVPDVSMLGYLKDRGLGAALYNAGHTYVAPGLLAGFGLWAAEPAVQAVALVWIAHIGFDRMLGYGLKYRDAFHATHLGRFGSRASGVNPVATGVSRRPD
jgi:hypothetical protein